MKQEGQQQESTNNRYYPLAKDDGRCPTAVPKLLTFSQGSSALCWFLKQSITGRAHHICATSDQEYVPKSCGISILRDKIVNSARQGNLTSLGPAPNGALGQMTSRRPF